MVKKTLTQEEKYQLDAEKEYNNRNRRREKTKQIHILDKNRISKELFFKNERVATIQIETLEDKNFVLGTFFMYIYNKGRREYIKCYFTESNETIFFDKIFDFSKGFHKKIICFFNSKSFNTKFLMNYCSKKLNIFPKNEHSALEIYQIRIPEYNIIFKDIDNSVKYSFLGKGFVENKISSCIYCYYSRKEKHHSSKNKINIHFPLSFYKSFNKLFVLKLFNSGDKILMDKAYNSIKDKIELDTIELYKAIQPFYSNEKIFCYE